ncbi:MAG: hypothetical protein LQ351_002836 [Letrouitia transgressa]|nr:MAG: hypothetical protein LQ351_002836 [Letrouitia transgressa]
MKHAANLWYRPRQPRRLAAVPTGRQVPGRRPDLQRPGHEKVLVVGSPLIAARTRTLEHRLELGLPRPVAMLERYPVGPAPAHEVRAVPPVGSGAWSRDPLGLVARTQRGVANGMARFVVFGLVEAEAAKDV